MNCLGDSDEIGYYNGFIDNLDIKFIFNDNKYVGFYLRIMIYCNLGFIVLIFCCKFLFILCLDLVIKYIFINI